MSEFSTSGSVHIEVDSGSLRNARDDLEESLGSVPVDVNALPNSSRFQDRLERSAANADVVVEPDVDESSMGSVSLDADMARPDGGATGLGGDVATIDELREQTDLLEDIKDDMDDVAGAGGGAGGGGGGGGGLVETGKSYLGLKGLQSLLGGGGGAGLGSALGGLGTAAGAVTLGSVGLAATSVYLTAEHPPNSEIGADDPGEASAKSTLTREQRASYFPGFDAEDFIGEEQWENKKEELANMPEDEMTTEMPSVTQMLENNPGKVTNIENAGKSTVALTFKGGGTETLPVSELPDNLYKRYMTGGTDTQAGGAETPTGLFGGPTGRRPGGTYGGRARDIAFGERLYTDVMGAGSNRTRPGPDTGGRTAGPGAEINAPVQLDVRAERPSADTVASEVIRQVEPQLKRELQQWLKRDGATNISDEQQSNYQEGF